MIEAWWKAHEFEFVACLIVFGAVLVPMFIHWIITKILESRRISREVDEHYKKLQERRTYD